MMLFMIFSPQAGASSAARHEQSRSRSHSVCTGSFCSFVPCSPCGWIQASGQVFWTTSRQPAPLSFDDFIIRKKKDGQRKRSISRQNKRSRHYACSMNLAQNSSSSKDSSQSSGGLSSCPNLLYHRPHAHSNAPM